MAANIESFPQSISVETLASNAGASGVPPLTRSVPTVPPGAAASGPIAPAPLGVGQARMTDPAPRVGALPAVGEATPRALAEGSSAGAELEDVTDLQPIAGAGTRSEAAERKRP